MVHLSSDAFVLADSSSGRDQIIKALTKARLATPDAGHAAERRGRGGGVPSSASLCSDSCRWLQG